ncbi:MAG: acyltransferase family protein [Gemmatimonadota bacterium]
MRDNTPDYRPDVDGLRAVAVVAVLGFHAFPRDVPGGFVGVDVFFVISGYLISGIIFKALDRGTFTFADFYARRIRRIFPALAVVLVATLALGAWLLLPDEFDSLWRHTIAGALFLSNILLWRETGYFDSSAEDKPLLHFWSLGVEEQFYLGWPLVLYLAWRLRLSRLGVIGVIGGASFLLNVWAIERYPGATFYLPLTRFWELLIGAGLAAGSRGAVQQSTRWLANLLSVAGMALVLVALLSFTGNDPFPGWRALLPAAGTAFVIAAGPAAWINRRLLSAPLAVGIGLVSYPLYLWHWPLISYLHITGLDRSPAGLWLRLAVLAVSFGLATLTHFALEKRVRRRASPAWVPQLATAMSLLVVAGLARGAWVRAHPVPLSDQNPFAWPASLLWTRECAVRYGLPAEHSRYALCVAPGDSAPAVVLLGDSHANALYPGLDSVTTGGSPLMIGGTSCPFLRYVQVSLRRGSDVGRREACPRITAAGYRALTGGPKSVVLGARYAYYTSGSGFGAAEPYLRLNFRSDSSTAATREQQFADEVERDVGFLLSAGHDVTLVLQTPELGFDARDCVRLRRTDRFRAPPRAGDCTVPRRYVEERQRHYRVALAPVLAKLASARLRVLDPLDVLCDNERCHGLINGRPLYRDDDHLSIDGSVHLWTTFAARGAPLATSAPLR